MAKKVDNKLAEIEKKILANIALSDEEDAYFLKHRLSMNDEDINFIMSDLPEKNDPDSKVY